jgi:hypothetical protein
MAFSKIRARHLNNRGKIGILANLFRKLLIDFRFWPHPAATPFCFIVSRQQCRRINHLQCLTSPTAATAFDNRRRIRLKQKILLTKGRLPEASREVEQVRCPRADLQSAPGRLGYQSPGTMTGAGGAPWTGTGEGG